MAVAGNPGAVATVRMVCERSQWHGSGNRVNGNRAVRQAGGTVTNGQWEGRQYVAGGT